MIADVNFGSPYAATAKEKKMRFRGTVYMSWVTSEGPITTHFGVRPWGRTV
jgi:hypothetical protein